MLSNLNSETDLEFSHQGASFTPQNERHYNTLCFDPHGNFKTLVAGGRVGMKILDKKNIPMCFRRYMA